MASKNDPSPLKNERTPATLAPAIIKAANQCVKCGLCLPHCPTYRLTQHEAESPRGRIALSEAIVNNTLTATPQLVAHLDRCLTCRACEAMCPAEVPYGQLIDDTRAYLLQSKHTAKPQTLDCWLTLLLTHVLLLKTAAKLAPTLFSWPWFHWLCNTSLAKSLHLDLVAPLLKGLPPFKSLATYYPARAQTTAIGEIVLLTGCITQIAARSTIAASITVLQQMGYHVHVPNKQGCCGALHWHSGDRKTAGQLQTAQQALIANYPNTTILSIDTGCSSYLQDLYKEDENWIPRSSRRMTEVGDLGAFLATHPLPPLKKQPCRIRLHTPCTLRNVLKGGHLMGQLLSQLPGLQMALFSKNADCCGAAGQYFIQQPGQSRALGQKFCADYLQTDNSEAIDFVVTPNIGCRLQIQQILRTAQRAVQVVHPVELVYNYLTNQ